MPVIDLKNCVVTLADGTGTPKTLAIKSGDGNLTFNVKTPRQYIKDRGTIDTVRDGDEEPMDLAIDSQFEWYKSNTGENVTPAEALYGLTPGNGSAAWVSAAASTCEPYAVDVMLANTVACTGGTKKVEVLTFQDFRVETCAFDIKAGTLKASGMCNINKPTSVRST